MKKILILGLANTAHLQGLIRQLKKVNENCQIDCISTQEILERDKLIADNLYELNFYYWYLKKIGRGSNLIFALNMYWLYFFSLKQKKYDSIQVHYLSLMHRFITPFLRTIASRRVAILWGSDIFRLPQKAYSKMTKLLMEFDVINCGTVALYQKAYKITNGKIEKKIIKHCHFGLELLDIINEMQDTSYNELYTFLGIDNPINVDYIITIGYNGSVGQQHLKIIEQLESFHKKNILFLFPMTYGASKEYIEEINRQLKNYNLNYQLLTDYMETKSVAALRILTDIFIQLQTTDALSGAMQEHMYAKNIVLTGSWLPYDSLDDIGVHFKKINQIEQVGDELNNILLNFDKEKELSNKNNDIIYHFSGWKNTISEWNALL